MPLSDPHPGSNRLGLFCVFHPSGWHHRLTPQPLLFPIPISSSCLSAENISSLFYLLAQYHHHLPSGHLQQPPSQLVSLPHLFASSLPTSTTTNSNYSNTHTKDPEGFLQKHTSEHFPYPPPPTPPPLSPCIKPFQLLPITLRMMSGLFHMAHKAVYNPTTSIPNPSTHKP